MQVFIMLCIDAEFRSMVVTKQGQGWLARISTLILVDVHLVLVGEIVVVVIYLSGSRCQPLRPHPLQMNS